MQVYIQYIVEHYDRLPASIVFMHAHRSAWHRGDAVGLLQRLRWGAVPFANLRYEVQSVRRKHRQPFAGCFDDGTSAPSVWSAERRATATGHASTGSIMSRERGGITRPAPGLGSI